MEPLWSPVVATGGNRRQIGDALKSRKQAKSVATGCHKLRETFHGKEGVSGSSPEEGFAKAPHTRGFCFVDSCASSRTIGYGSLFGTLRILSASARRPYGQRATSWAWADAVEGGQKGNFPRLSHQAHNPEVAGSNPARRGVDADALIRGCGGWTRCSGSS